ncbi:hypothetical protein P879_11584 [Paragonimus westermani]|uniref:Peptidase M60 domain-containing protein n=1 Tax=Paragonimus westermani TaxID=34504 RepID=A0A8T0D712_9TREM|nr:hypothetical protein P879_11584 [Paragonimus westermani]
MIVITVLKCILPFLIQEATGQWRVEETNVALRKTVRGRGFYMDSLVDGDNQTMSVPDSSEYRAAFFVDLGAVYELSSINLYGQSYQYEDHIGLNAPFSVFTWANYTPICDMDLQYPWNLVKGGLRFTRDHEKLVLSGPMTAQYIIVMMDRHNPGTKVKTLIMSEIEAFGRKIRDAYVPPTPRLGIRPRNTFGATLADRLKMGAQSWSYFKTNKIFNPNQPEDLTTDEVQTAIKQIIDNYGEYFAHNAPCDWKPYVIASSTFTAMLNYNNVILSQRGENITRLPAFSRIMGDVHPKANPTSYSVTLKVTAKSNFFPIGAYAKAGEAFRYQVKGLPPHALGDFGIRVNPQTDTVYETHKNLTRWPIMTSNQVLQAQGSFASPVGGVITLQLPANSNITIRLENVYRYAWFDIRNPRSIHTWNMEQRKHQYVPFTMVMGDRLITMLETSTIMEMDKENMLFSVNYFDNVVKMMHNYRGTDFQSAPFLGFVVDEQIFHGGGHSGWPGEPMMGHKYWGPFFQDMNMIKSGKSIGITHEIGHNLQPDKVTFINGMEVTCNIFIPLVHSFLLNISAYEFGVSPGLGEDNMKQLVKDWNGNKYTGVQLAYYNILGHYFSHGLVGNALTTVFADRVQLANEQEKVNYWVKLISLEAGYDLVPFHRLWHFSIDRNTTNATQHLPCFFPDDQLTKKVPTLVNRILRQYGKPCSRQRPKVVQFRGDLMHGVNKVDKQFIFIRG